MKKHFLKRSCFSIFKTFVLFCAAAVIFSGCARFKEEFNKGLEQGRKRAKQDAGANSGEVQPTPTPLALTDDNLSEARIANLSEQTWKYRPGDDPSWALPETGDADWETLTPAATNNFIPPRSGWSGIGWFRLHFNVDDSLVNQPLGLITSHPGASEIYADGKLMQTFGVVAANAEEERTYNPRSTPVGITFTSAGAHTIAVRYSNTQAKKYPIEQPGFQFRLAPLNSTIVESLADTALIKSVKGGTFGIGLALGLLHLLLFLLYPRQSGNLFYSLFLLSEAASSFLMESFMAHYGTGAVYLMMMIGIFTGSIYFVSFTAYLYTVLENRLPRYLRIMAALWLLALLLNVIASLGIGVLPSTLVFTAAFLVFISTMLWHMVVVSIVIIRAIARKVDNSWILGVVGVAFLISSLSSTVLAIAFGENSKYLFVSQFICLTALIVANAVFLARQFARTSTDLEKQLVKEVEHEKEKSRLLVIEAENERRAKELEEARQLQLSLLPKKLPQLPQIEIAAYMKPATEVGGDYYDFHVSSDGTLTVAVGDATGHGLKAGTMVTATKSLFNNLAEEANIPNIFKSSSIALKRMNLRGMFMAMTMAKIKNNSLVVSCAGMPPILIYRAATNEVEELSLKALPLGSLLAANYDQREFTLAPGDCVLLMSDGFPEMFNERGEMIGFQRAAEILPEVAERSPQEIIDFFVSVAKEWANGRPQDDDVTFVVLKIKADAIQI